MKTAREILESYPELFIETDRHTDDAIAVMKLYAIEVAKNTLLESSYKFRHIPLKDKYGMTYDVFDMINKTEIITP